MSAYRRGDRADIVVRTVVMRGGTSRGLFLHEHDLPAAGQGRDRVVLALIGSPDPAQVDGLGGGRPTTSKVVVVNSAPHDRDADVSYQVGNVGIDTAVVDWQGTCGNLTAAVPVFAIEEGLVSEGAAGTRVRLRNLSTGGLIHAHVPTPNRVSIISGDEQISTEYLRPGGGVLGSQLPTGHPINKIDLDGDTVHFSVVDVTHPYLMVRTDEFIPNSRDAVHPDALTPGLLARLERLRGVVAQMLGLVDRPGCADTESPAVPRTLLISRGAHPAEFAVTALSMGHPITTLPMSAAMCISAARLIPGTIPALLSPQYGRAATVISSPSGEAEATAVPDGHGGIASTTVCRTTRTLMRGDAYLRMPLLDIRRN